MAGSSSLSFSGSVDHHYHISKVFYYLTFLENSSKAKEDKAEK